MCLQSFIAIVQKRMYKLLITWKLESKSLNQSMILGNTIIIASMWNV